MTGGVRRATLRIVGNKSRRAILLTAFVPAIACALHACTFVDPLDDLIGATEPLSNEDAATPPPPDGATDASGAGNAPEERCIEAPYDGGKVSAGFLCGVGDCRKHLYGPSCTLVTLADGGKVSPCALVYPEEELGNGLDDDCDGVVDEGQPSVAADAGFTCQGCAFGVAVQRLADGTLETAGGAENRKARFNTRDCINSERCKLGTAAWVRNVSMMKCSDFCKSVGGTCKEACSTSAPGCTGRGIGMNLGTYSADYHCVIPPNHPYNPNAGAPLTGACDAVIYPEVVEPSVDFNMFCCCEI